MRPPLLPKSSSEYAGLLNPESDYVPTGQMSESKALSVILAASADALGCPGSQRTPYYTGLNSGLLT